jgi:RNA polymerase sigma factor (sigma-70 family)
MIEDSELLRRYVLEKSEAAFAELVNRHINPVYAGALRRLGGDTHLAEDVTQRVFTALAAAAGKLAGRSVLAGWLHVTTRNIAAQVVRTERRRTARELEAHTMNDSSQGDPARLADWERLRPVIDGAMDELDERDREAVLLRYFEDRSLAEVGARLQLTENAARMRVDRALERMHGLLLRRGVNSTVGALALVLTSQAKVAAPGGLAATVTGAALSGAVAGTASLALLNLMSTAKIITTIASIAAIAAAGIAINQNRQRNLARAELAAASHDLQVAAARLAAVEQELQGQTAKAKAAERDTAALLAVIDTVEATTEAEAKTPITHDLVQSRFKHGQDLVRSGNFDAALAEFLWCYDEGMVRATGFGGVRNSFLTNALGRLGASYPPALAALRERRDRAEALMLAGTNEMGAAMDFAALNAALNDNARNLAVFDKLPTGDRRRQGLMVRVYDQLLAAKRYQEAAEGRPYSQMVTLFEAMAVESPIPTNMPNPENFRQITRKNIVTNTAKNIEVLAGAGQLENARLLAEKVLAYDNTGETRAIIQECATRAGHPELLTVPPPQ